MKFASCLSIGPFFFSLKFIVNYYKNEKHFTTVLLTSTINVNPKNQLTAMGWPRDPEVPKYSINDRVCMTLHVFIMKLVELNNVYYGPCKFYSNTFTQDFVKIINIHCIGIIIFQTPCTIK